MTQSSDDKKRDEVLKRMLTSPPKKQKELKKDLADRRLKAHAAVSKPKAR